MKQFVSLLFVKLGKKLRHSLFLPNVSRTAKRLIPNQYNKPTVAPMVGPMARLIMKYGPPSDNRPPDEAIADIEQVVKKAMRKDRNTPHNACPTPA